MQIPIVVVADSNYVVPMVITISSLLLSAEKQTIYDVRILTDHLFKEDCVSKLQERIHKDNFKYKIHRIGLEQFGNAVIRSEGLSVFTYARLLIPFLLRDCEKCIYLDTDTIVMQDLSDLYQTDMNLYYVAGVKDYGVQMKVQNSYIIEESYSIESIEDYVNAGVLLMNLKKIRDEKIDVAFKRQIGKNWRYEDQDIINKCCYGKKAFLPVKYNVLYRYYQRSKYWKKGFYSEEDMRQAEEYPVILHYTGRDMKPWKYLGSRAAGVWWKFAKAVTNELEFQKIYENAQECWKKMQWDYIRNTCKNKVIIWGFSDKGKKLYGWLKNCGIEVVYFCDSDKKKQGILFDNSIEVKAIEELMCDKNIKEYIFVIASQGYFTAIEKQLQELGVKNIIRFFYKSEFYYMALDESQYDREIKEIEEKEKQSLEQFTEEIKECYWMEKWYFSVGG